MGQDFGLFVPPVPRSSRSLSRYGILVFRRDPFICLDPRPAAPPEKGGVSHFFFSRAWDAGQTDLNRRFDRQIQLRVSS